MIQSLRSNLVDPFEEHSIISLNSRTFGISKDALKSNDLEAIHQHMKSIALQLQIPDNDFEKARLIVDGSGIGTKDMEGPRERRPALSRKRAKFSMKPDICQSSTVVEPSFEIDPSQDPDEFFAAFEVFENARKELIKQRGGEDLTDAKFSNTVRKRRPEIPRRKAIYKHYEYSSQSQNDTSFTQEILKDNIANNDSQQEPATLNCESEEDKVAGSVTKTEERINKQFDELITSNISNLDENEALSFLKNHLNIKPVEIKKLQLPDLHNIPRVKFTSLFKDSIENQNKSSDKYGFLDASKGQNGKQKKLPDNPFNPLASPTPPKSPFLAISTLGKKLSKSIELNDPFSTEMIGEHLSPVGKDNYTPVVVTLDSSEKKKVPEASIDFPEQCHNIEEVGPSVVSYTQTDEGINENVEDTVQKEDSVTQVELNVEDITDKVHPECVQDREDNVNTTDKTGSSDLPEVNVEVSTVEDLENQKSWSDANPIEGLDASRPAKDPDIVPEQQNEPRNKRRKTRTKKGDQKKRRQSLAEAGCSWTTGVRRSNRVRRRPLEYWKGERLLYGRVHDSLPTVIGVKYKEDNGKPGFKVESFVSDEYKELVELIALH